MPTPGRFHIDPDDPRPLYIQIMDEVRRSIVNGIMGQGDSLPSVRDLAGELRVNPNTVQQAYRELERDGVVYVRRGQGTYVSPDADTGEIRDRVLGELADRVLREAARSGVTRAELIAALDTHDDRSIEPSREDE